MDTPLHLKNENQYEKAIARMFRLMHERLKRNSPEKKELKLLSRLIEDYENRFYPLVSAL